MVIHSNNTGSDKERNYPNLAPCMVVIQNAETVAAARAGGTHESKPKKRYNKPPVRLPQDVLETVNRIKNQSNGGDLLPAPYDFDLENQILKTKEEREKLLAATVTSSTGDNDSSSQEGNANKSREELRRNLVVRMKSVTNADETVCVSLLESNNYDLKTSIEAYFSQDQ